jgi:hypothetical protein
MHKTFALADYNIDGVTPFLPLDRPGNSAGIRNTTMGVFDTEHVNYRRGPDYPWTAGGVGRRCENLGASSARWSGAVASSVSDSRSTQRARSQRFK